METWESDMDTDGTDMLSAITPITPCLGGTGVLVSCDSWSADPPSATTLAGLGGRGGVRSGSSSVGLSASSSLSGADST